MPIEIKKGKSIVVEGAYALTYAPVELLALKGLTFPLVVSPEGAEVMLHALALLAQKHGEVYDLLHVIIGAKGLQAGEEHTPEGRLPFRPLLQTLVGEERLHQVVWGDADTDITKLPSGIEVNDSGTRFFYPYNHSFAQWFIEAVGESVFEDEPMHASSYLHKWRYRGEHDIFGILEPYKTLWVDNGVYSLMCSHLRALCHRVENALGEELFQWEGGAPGASFLVELIRRNLQLDDR